MKGRLREEEHTMKFSTKSEEMSDLNSEPSQDGKPAPKRSKNKRAIVGGIAAAIVVIAIGFWVWHNDPSFCNNPVCHDSMDPYVSTYYQDDKSVGVDKWGNDVQNTHAMLVVSHKADDVACLGCHVPSIAQQVHEVGVQFSGSYEKPLAEVDALSLIVNSNKQSASGTGDEFCMNDKCHKGVTRWTLTRMFEGKEFNPHSWHHAQNQCTDCHKSHRASVLVCTQCHNGSDPDKPDATDSIPEGWLDYDTAVKLQKTSF